MIESISSHINQDPMQEGCFVYLICSIQDLSLNCFLLEYEKYCMCREIEEVLCVWERDGGYLSCEEHESLWKLATHTGGAIIYIMYFNPCWSAFCFSFLLSPSCLFISSILPQFVFPITSCSVCPIISLSLPLFS